LTAADEPEQNPAVHDEDPTGGEKTMFSLRTKTRAYYFCSRCRARMSVIKDDGDILHLRCPQWSYDNWRHDTFLSYQTLDGLRNYALVLFRPNPEQEQGGAPFRP
jgi:hypothetical protein